MFPFNDIEIKKDDHVQNVNAGLAYREQKKPQIRLQLEETEAVLSTVLGRAHKLRERLEPIMTQTPNSPMEVDASVKASTAMGEFIENINQQLHTLNEVLAHIDQNLQI